MPSSPQRRPPLTSRRRWPDLARTRSTHVSKDGRLNARLSSLSSTWLPATGSCLCWAHMSILPVSAEYCRPKMSQWQRARCNQLNTRKSRAPLELNATDVDWLRRPEVGAPNRHLQKELWSTDFAQSGAAWQGPKGE
jgi:hypothetical protein